ncbi:MAG TPA: hypothetical protein VN666_05160 [Nitrospira sp.]|nr:hypothetical protein [Nitrospira sp.]
MSLVILIQTLISLGGKRSVRHCKEVIEPAGERYSWTGGLPDYIR